MEAGARCSVLLRDAVESEVPSRLLRAGESSLLGRGPSLLLSRRRGGDLSRERRLSRVEPPSLRPPL